MRSASLIPRFGIAVAAMQIVLLTGGSAVAAGSRQPTEAHRPELPFRVGEVLSYQARSSRFGTFGTGELRIDEMQAGYDGLVRLSFDFRGKVGPFRIQDASESWFDSERLLSRRYAKTERSPLGNRSESVEMNPADRSWTSAQGKRATSQTDAPLDELSFLYFIRTLPLDDGEVHTLSRHFDDGRNPVVVRVVGRQKITVPAGEFTAIQVEMQVRDGRFSGGGGALQLYLSDDPRRIPLRIDTSAAWIGRTSLLLTNAVCP